MSSREYNQTGESNSPEFKLRQFDLDTEFPPEADISDIFLKLTSKLEEIFDIDRGLLMIRESEGTRFLAVSTWTDIKTRKNLSLRIPETSSLFDKVAEQGVVYTESFCELFSGNSFERNLLLKPEAHSYMILPLKHEGRVVGLLGYSSKSPVAFPAVEEGLLNRIGTQLAGRIARKLQVAQTSPTAAQV